MKQVYQGRRRFDLKRPGLGLFALFVLFIAYRILTPPNHEIATVASPDGRRIARLRKFYYVSQPSYKVDWRESDKAVWLNLYYLSSYTNVPHQTAVESLTWSDDSAQLTFSINGTSVWHHRFR